MNAVTRPTTGAEYAVAICAEESDRRCRATFQQLVLEFSRPGDALLDFGAGPGLDAHCYAEHGRRVVTYDVDVDMSRYLETYCREFIAAGSVTPWHAAYRQFLEADEVPGGRFALITANFAPLNLIDDVTGLFRRFATLAAPDGLVLASVLSPYYAGDARYVWWWRNAARLCVQGRYAVPGASSNIWRRTPADFARACKPHFHLAQAWAGNRTGVPGRASWLHLARCRYMFLLFRRAGTSPQGRAARRA